jgi:hypothetical protein
VTSFDEIHQTPMISNERKAHSQEAQDRSKETIDASCLYADKIQ